MTTRRKGSAEAMASIPHTRLQDEDDIAAFYQLGTKLGQGSFGKVHEATHIKSGERRAIKSINKEKAGSSALKLLEREVAILKRVNHPNIIQLFEVLETPKRMFLVMEVCEGGELADALKEKLRFSEDEARGIMTKLASAISYLHKNDIVHRDLKLENILLTKPSTATEDLDIRVTDFGLSVTKGGVTPDNMMQDFCGTPMYMAPEIIDNKTYSQQCDVWAMGVIMYLLLSGCPPFKSKDEESLYDLIRQGNVDFSEEIWSSISGEARRCVSNMIKVDPAYRLSAAEVLEEPWISGKPRDHSRPANVLDMMKQWGPEMRKPTSNVAINGAGSEGEEEAGTKEEEQSSSSQEKAASSTLKPSKVDATDSSSRAGSSINKKGRSPPSSATRHLTVSSSKGSARQAASTSATPRSGSGALTPKVALSQRLAAHSGQSVGVKSNSTSSYKPPSTASNHKSTSHTSLQGSSVSKTKKK